MAGNHLANSLSERFDSMVFPGENKVLNTADFVLKRTQDPRGGLSHLLYSVRGREWQIDILNDLSEDICVQKCSQIGASEIFFRKAIAMCAHYGLDVAYVFPTLSMIRKYVPARIDPVILASRRLNEMLKRPHSTEHKRFVNGSNLYFIHSNSDAARISTALDAVFLDEYDRCDSKNYDAWPQRMGNSPHKIFSRFSTATAPEVGINGLYLASDKKSYFIKCDACNHQQVMRFPESIRFKKGLLGMPEFHMEMPERVGIKRDTWRRKYLEREPYIGCLKCGAKLDRTDSSKREWVAEDRSVEISGYHLTRFNVPRYEEEKWGHSATTIINDFFKVLKLVEFYNQVLGEPYSSGSDSIDDADIAAALDEPGKGFDTFWDRSPMGTYMGIDQGKRLHISILLPRGQNMRLVHVEEIDMAQDGKPSANGLKMALDRIHKLMRNFRVRFVMCDGQPDINFPRALARRFPKKVSWCSFNRNTKDHTVPSDNKWDITVNRTWALGSVAEMLQKGHDQYELLLPAKLRSTYYGETLCNHLKALVRVEVSEEDDKTKKDVTETVWMKKGGRDDHFFFSTAYAYTAFNVHQRLRKTKGSYASHATGIRVVNTRGLM